ncbi:MAG: hypothetical protein LBP26_00295 [Clostridiales bacterium]|jgi:hypothetical protein|nr:hypothetical protein [Clostridiales bacterium]
MQENRYAARRRSYGILYYDRIVFAVSVVSLSVCAAVFLLAARAGYFKTAAREFYYVSVFRGGESGAARTAAEQNGRLGGAGYIINDGEFKVAAAVYAKKADAETVAARLLEAGYSASVLPLYAPGRKHADTKNGQTNAKIKAYYSVIDEMFSRLDAAAAALERGESTEALALRDASLLYEKCQKLNSEVAGLQNGEAAALALLYPRYISSFDAAFSRRGAVPVLSLLRWLNCALVYDYYSVLAAD